MLLMMAQRDPTMLAQLGLTQQVREGMGRGCVGARQPEAVITSIT
jgi:hypothetical protein